MNIQVMLMHLQLKRNSTFQSPALLSMRACLQLSANFSRHLTPSVNVAELCAATCLSETPQAFVTAQLALLSTL